MTDKVLDIRSICVGDIDYQVVVDDRTTPWGTVRHLEISRKDNQPVHSWWDLQYIKNALCGAHRAAMEIYPTWDRVIDVQHAYHLWVLPADFTIPFGIHEKDNLGE